MYKVKVNEWKLAKNAAREDYLGFARLYQEQAAPGRPEIFIKIHQKIRCIQDLRKYLKNHGEDETAFFAEARDSQVPIPEHIQFCDSNGKVEDNDAAVVAVSEQPKQAMVGATQNDVCNCHASENHWGLTSVLTSSW